MAPDEREGQGYLGEVLRDAARPFAYRTTVRTLIGVPPQGAALLSSVPPPPLGAFPYLRTGGPWQPGPAVVVPNNRLEEWVDLAAEAAALAPPDEAGGMRKPRVPEAPSPHASAPSVQTEVDEGRPIARQAGPPALQNALPVMPTEPAAALVASPQVTEVAIPQRAEPHPSAAPAFSWAYPTRICSWPL
jgi:hypothetical protein